MSDVVAGINNEFSRLLRRGPEKARVAEQDGWRAVYYLEPDFAGFEGHFPDYPLMPALMQVLMAGHMLEKALGRKIVAESLPTAKFTGQALPGDELFVTAFPARSREGLEAWDVSIAKVAGEGEKTVASFKILLHGALHAVNGACSGNGASLKTPPAQADGGN